MKKKALSLALAAVLTAGLLTACGSSSTGTSAQPEGASEPAAETTASQAPESEEASSESASTQAAETEVESKGTVTVAATSVPHAEILEAAVPLMAAKGWELKVTEFTDYVQPNEVVESGDMDANYFQHTPYLESFNASNNTKLAAVAKIHYEPFGIYGNGITDLKDLKDGATIIIPADDSNETRALFLLAQENLIKLADGSTVEKGVTTLDIVDDGGYNITAVQADTVAAQLKNADAGSIAVINGNYALAAGLKIADALASEDASGEAAQTYANIVAVRKADVDSAKTKALVAALTTQKVKDYINNTYNGAVVPIF